MKVVVFYEEKLLFSGSPSAALNTAEFPEEAVGLIKIKLLLVSPVKVTDALESDRVILPTKSTAGDYPPVMVTETSAVVTDQEVKVETVEVLGALLIVLTELLPLPSQDIKKIVLIINTTYLIFFLPIGALCHWTLQNYLHTQYCIKVLYPPQMLF